MDGTNYVWIYIGVAFLVVVGFIAYRMFSSKSASEFEVTRDADGSVSTRLSKTAQDETATVSDIDAEGSGASEIEAAGEGSSVSGVKLKDSPGVKIKAGTGKK